MKKDEWNEFKIPYFSIIGAKTVSSVDYVPCLKMLTTLAPFIVHWSSTPLAIMIKILPTDQI